MAWPAAIGWSFQVEENAEGARIHFPGPNFSLDETNVILAGKELGKNVEAGCRCLILDFRNVSYLTSSALGMLLRLHTQLKAPGGRLELFNLAPHIEEIFALTRLNQILSIRSDSEANLS
jgi:anti-anti-sigma factor